MLKITKFKSIFISRDCWRMSYLHSHTTENILSSIAAWKYPLNDFWSFNLPDARLKPGIGRLFQCHRDSHPQWVSRSPPHFSQHLFDAARWDVQNPLIAKHWKYVKISKNMRQIYLDFMMEKRHGVWYLFSGIFKRNIDRLIHLVPHHDMWKPLVTFLPRRLTSPHHSAMCINSQAASKAMASIPSLSPWSSLIVMQAYLEPPHLRLYSN